VTARRKDGSTFPAYVRDKVLVGRGGVRTGTIGVAVDLSERVAAERELLAARNYLRAVTGSMGEGLYVLDAEGRLTYINEAAEQMLGWPGSELLGTVMHEATYRRRADGTPMPMGECPISRACSEGVINRVEDDVFIRRDGHEIPVSYTAAPFETDDGVEGVVVVFEDISERKAREAALQEEADKLAWIGRVQDALAEDRFVLYAQPIIDLKSGDVVQHELLLRLRDPDGTIAGPGAYLHIAEQYGLIGDIDRWVIQRGAEIAASGRPVEINISGRSISDPELPRHIERCIEASGADPTLLVFEITETALVEDEDAARALGVRLHELGCKLALDDFGTGYGGFTYLKHLAIDYLKIDIEFVRDLATNPASRHVVDAVVSLARGFGLQTVAEGVEDAEALALLRELGVDFAQGYHIGRPAPLP
jgi:PAS domain S-box-containing protein